MKTFSQIRLSLAIVILLIGQEAFANQDKDDQTNNYNYETIYDGTCDAFTCIRDISPALQEKLAANNQRIIQVYLVRHAKPNVNKPFIATPKSTQRFLDNYDRFDIIPFDPQMVKVSIDTSHVIYCSTLHRSIQTAETIFSNTHEVQSFDVFREFQNKAVNAPAFLPLPIDIWRGLSRGSWMLGLNHGGIESFKEARKRSKAAAAILAKTAELQRTSVLVGHGMLNGYISKELQRQGWVEIRKKGHINLGATILIKVVSNN
ncbi:hypothetical protein EYV94_12405 [Puteibacter caeruleilacunae]|nr:hypothetical protein EYV94_12405 [Puteibacter caeruleilacunae]